MIQKILARFVLRLLLPLTLISGVGGATGQVTSIDTSHSRLLIHVSKSGVFSGFADNHDVEFHGLARGQFFGTHGSALRTGTISSRLRLFPIFARRTTMEMLFEAFRCNAIRPTLPTALIKPATSNRDARSPAQCSSIARLLSGGRGRLRAGRGTGQPAKRSRNRAKRGGCKSDFANL